MRCLDDFLGSHLKMFVWLLQDSWYGSLNIIIIIIIVIYVPPIYFNRPQVHWVLDTLKLSVHDTFRPLKNMVSDEVDQSLPDPEGSFTERFKACMEEVILLFLQKLVAKYCNKLV